MSGHSHFKTVKATKDANDAKKGKIFSKFGRVITIAAKETGGDMSSPKLKAAIDKAREFNMPKENIERAIKKGTGELAGENLEEITFEGFGPGGIVIIVEGITDNKNRTLGEIKTVFNLHEGKLANEGAVRWMFDKKGLIAVLPEGKSKEELELLAIEVGAQDVQWNGTMLDVYTNPEDLEKIKKSLEEKGLHLESAALAWVPKEEVALDEKEKSRAQKLFEALDENDAVQDIYSNLKA